MKIHHIIAICASASISGCALPTDEVGKFTAGTATADSTVKNLLAGRAAAIAEVEFSRDSQKYINGKLKLSSSHSCNKDISYEIELHDKRLAALTELDEYVKSLQEYLAPPEAFTTATKVIEGASKLGTSLGVQNAVASTLVTLLQQAEVNARAFALGTLARSKQGTVEKISANLKAGLKPAGKEYAAILNNWEVCEYEKLVIFGNLDPQASLIEKESRLRLFYDTRAKLKASMKNAIEAETIFDDLPKLHKKIIEGGTDIGKNLDVLGKTLGAGQALIAAEQAATATPAKSGS